MSLDSKPLTAIERFRHVDSDLIAGVFDEAGRFASEVIAPLSRVGDTVGSVHNGDGTVSTPPGYREAYKKFVEAGWPAAGFPEDIGGGGLPWAVAAVVQEMIITADMGFSLCPMLTYGTVDMLHLHGTDEQKSAYLAQARDRRVVGHHGPHRTARRFRRRCALDQGGARR